MIPYYIAIDFMRVCWFFLAWTFVDKLLRQHSLWSKTCIICSFGYKYM